MKMLARVIAVVVTVGMFSACAWAADANAPKHPGMHGQRPGAPSPADRVQMQLDRLSKQLNLTDDQKAKIKPILTEQVEKMDALRKDQSLQGKERQEKMMAIAKETNEKITPVLTAEQQEKFKAMTQQMRERGQERRAEHKAPKAAEPNK